MSTVEGGTQPVPLDPIDPTPIGPGLAAIPLEPTPWDDAEDKRERKFAASVVNNYKHHWVGHFDTVEDAASAVRAKRNELFTHNDADRLALTGEQP